MKSNLSQKYQALGFAVCVAIVFLAAALGAAASVGARDFYASLSVPSWAPPGWLFGPVWSTLFCMMALSLWLVWRIDGYRSQAKLLNLFGLQLGANALWSWLFFVWNLGGAAFAEVLLLWVLILVLIWGFWRLNRLAALLLVPYLLWVSFASVLTYACWTLNPELLS